MSVCLCESKRRDGTRVCRAPVIAESGAMDCGRAMEVVAAVRSAIADAQKDAILGVDVDALTLVHELRAAGWRIEARRMRAVKS